MESKIEEDMHWVMDEPCPANFDRMLFEVHREPGKDPKVVKKEPAVNRPKAILFQCLFGALQFCYMLIFKGKVRASGVDPTDFMFMRCIVVFVWTTIAILVL